MDPHPVPISTLDPAWSMGNPACPPMMRPDEVHVWRWSRNAGGRAPSRWVSILSAPERGQLRAFVRADDANDFLARRVFLRTLLSGYLDADPSHLRFARRCASCGSMEHGKPRLAMPPSSPGLEFSASSSRGEVLVGVGGFGPLGVDVERFDPSLPLEALAAYANSQAERRAMRSGSSAVGRSRFLRFWTLKEAYLKGLGLGLARDPTDLSVVCDHAGPRWLVDSGALGRALDWRLVAVGAGDCHFALAQIGEIGIRWICATPPAVWLQ